jgi:hypothetical protein
VALLVPAIVLLCRRIRQHYDAARRAVALHRPQAGGHAVPIVPTARGVGDQLPLEVVVSPYRALVAPLTAYVRELHEQRPDLTITVVVSQVVAKRRWQRLLHSDVGSRLGRALRPLPGIVITSVPFHLPI